MNELNTLIESEYSKIEERLREYISEQEKKILDLSKEDNKVINITYNTETKMFEINDIVFNQNIEIRWLAFNDVFDLWNNIRNNTIQSLEAENDKIKREIAKIEEFLKNKELYLEVEIVFNKLEPVITHTYNKKYQFIKALV